MDDAYVHGYHERENERLQDQAGALVELLHVDTRYGAGSRVLEAGCGVGAQTLALARRSPEAHVGRRIFPLMVEAGFDEVRVDARMVYVDSSHPELVDAGVRALYRTTEADGVFCYTFFKGVGEKRA